ncbi:MAG: hypothetical protein MJE77_30705 [Proteobacteria bacterium]|nr:hypothetical protein [Pseudomonadota bacterium]
MHTNRLNNVAERQRVNHVRDFFFVILVAAILVFQLVSLSQSNAFSATSSPPEDTAEPVETALPEHCLDPAAKKLATLPDSFPLC